MTSLIERRKQIIDQTETEGRVDVDTLAEHFDVSKVTIRNDLNALSSRGLVVRSRGGAVASNRITRELSVEEKYHENLSVKRRLGEAVVGLLDKSIRSLLLDSGTTTEEVARNLGDHRSLTVMTNGLNIAKVVASNRGVEVMVTGGTLRPTSMSFYGRQAEESLRYMHFDCLILGVDGFDPSVGITTHFEPEAILNRLMCSVADKIIVVTDSSKFGKRGPHIICRHTEISALVTDTDAPAEIIDLLKSSGVEIHQVES